MKKSLIHSILIFAFIEFALLLLITGSAPDDTNFSPNQNQFANSLPYQFQRIDSGFVRDRLPINDYLNTRSFEEPINLRIEVDLLIDSNRPNDIEVEDTLAWVITDKLYDLDSSKYTLITPDEILRRIQWAEKLKLLSQIDLKRGVFFQIVSDYWLKKMAGKLDSIGKMDKNAFYNRDFIYLSNRLQENNYPVKYEVSNTEKILINLHKGKFGYLWLRFTNKSLIFQSAVAVLIIINLSLIIIALRALILKKQL